MDKSNPNMMRVPAIKKEFQNSTFIAMVRNPYAQVEGIMRRNGATAEYAAKFALKCLRYQKQNKLSEKENILFTSYEELCDTKYEVVEKIKEFIPEIGNIDSDLEFSAHNFKTDCKMKIQNLNKEKIKKINKENMGIINSYFNKEIDLLEFFGYSIIE